MSDLPRTAAAEVARRDLARQIPPGPGWTGQPNSFPPSPSTPWFSVCRRYTPARSIESMRVLVVEDEPYMAEAIRDGLRLEAIAADIAGDGDTALESQHHSTGE